MQIEIDETKINTHINLFRSIVPCFGSSSYCGEVSCKLQRTRPEMRLTPQKGQSTGINAKLTARNIKSSGPPALR